MDEIVFEPYTVNDGSFHASLPIDVAWSDAQNTFRVRVDLRIAFEGNQISDGQFHVELTDDLALLSDVAGAIFHATIDLDTSWSASTLSPDIALFMANVPIDVDFAGSQINDGEFHASASLQAFLTDATAAFRASNDLSTWFTDGGEASGNSAFLLQFMAVASHGIPGAPETIAEALAFTGSIDQQQIMVRRALLALGDVSVGLLTALDRHGDTLGFTDIAGYVWRMLHVEALALGDTPITTLQLLVEATDLLALAADAGSILDAAAAVVEALQLGDAAGYGWPVSVLETLALGDSATLQLLALTSAQSALSLGDSGSISATFTTLVPETLQLGASASTQAELLELIREGLAVLVRIQLPDGMYLAWVCHTESKAFTTYRNFPFNSFCEIDGHYYGATDEGIYLLEGDDDAGEPIEARVRGGLSDMGTGRLKRMEALYWGLSADGQMLVKVVTTSEEGEKTESWYSLDAPPGGAMREGRTKIGKGLKSVYWGFEIANVDGADFELDKIAWLPMILDRRISNG